MKLTGEQVEQIHEALLSGYDLSTLRMMVRMKLDLDLAAIAGGDNTSVVVFNLIDWAERKDNVLRLIAGAHQYNPDNVQLAALAQQAPAWGELAPPSPQPLTGARLSNWQKAGIEWVKIPTGEFLYGDAKKTVYLDEFWISRTPVTNRQYAVFVAAAGYKPPQHWEGRPVHPARLNHPVVYVSWEDAQKFCEWAGVFLPTEQQWEKAARGTDGREYPWGNQAPSADLCNYNSNVKDTTPVRGYSPQGDSPFSIVDMAGNVWELCEERTLRGGSFYSDVRLVRCAARSSRISACSYEGFRVVFPGS